MKESFPRVAMHKTRRLLIVERVIYAVSAAVVKAVELM